MESIGQMWGPDEVASVFAGFLPWRAKDCRRNRKTTARARLTSAPGSFSASLHAYRAGPLPVKLWSKKGILTEQAS
jgi:hypothetical protein